MRLLAAFLGACSTILLPGVSQAGSQSRVGSSFESYTDTIGCISSACVLSFPQIPVGKIYRVEKVTCRVAAQKRANTFILGPSVSPNSAIFLKENYLVLDYTNSNSTGMYHYQIFRSQPDMLVGGGKYLTVAYYAGDTGQIDMSCAMTGTVVQG